MLLGVTWELCVESRTYESTGAHFWAGGDGLGEKLQDLSLLETLSSGNGFGAGSVA